MKKGEFIRDLNVTDIQKYQQNRFPILFIDRVDEILVGSYAKGIKQFSYNEWFFPSHFPDDPNVPGFIQVEALTQMFLMTFLSMEEIKGSRTSFISIEHARFREKIVPGDTLSIHAELSSYRRGIAKGTSMGTINGKTAVELSLTVGVPDVLNAFKPKV